MLYRSQNHDFEPRRGVVIVAVLVVIVLLTLAAYQYNEMMMAEDAATDSYVRAEQAKSFAESGINYTALLLSDPAAFESTLYSNPFNNPSAFQGIVISEHESPRRNGRFSVVSPLSDANTAEANQPFRYGCTDESGKINLNGLLKLTGGDGEVAAEILARFKDYVPGMSEDIAKAIIDWLDEDDDGGAESTYYSSLSPPYAPKNGPLETIEELLYVKGVTPELLFGNDRNRNGMLDPDEDAGNGEFNRGLSAYLTVYSREQNTDSEGSARIYLNDRENVEELYDKLLEAVGDEAVVKYLMAYRNSRPSRRSSSQKVVQLSDMEDPGELLSAADLPESALGLSGRSRPQRITSLFSLIGTAIEIPGSGRDQPATRYACPFNDPETLSAVMPILWDKTTTTRDTDLPTRVNVNTAPVAVLSVLPVFYDVENGAPNEELIQKILDNRPDPMSTEEPDPIYKTPVWLYAQADLTVDQIRTLERLVTTRTQVYRVQVVGYFDEGGPVRRIEAIIDTNRLRINEETVGRPRIVYWRDLSELGRGFDVTSGLQR